MRERRRRFKVKSCADSNKCLWWRSSRNVKRTRKYVQKDDFCERIVTEMQKTISMGSEAIIQKVLLGLVRSY